MKIIIFGATGGTGKLLVTQALAKGHTVSVFVRNPAGLPQDSRLRVIQGDLFDFATVVDAVRGHRAVLSALGARTRKREGVLAEAIPLILEGMRQEYVQRLVVLGSAGGHRDYGKYQNALTRMGFWAARNIFLKHPYTDQAAQERLLAQSDVDYTIVRAPRLMDGPFTGKYRVLPDALPPGGLKVNRADVADFMLLQLTDPRFHRQGPYISANDD